MSSISAKSSSLSLLLLTRSICKFALLRLRQLPSVVDTVGIDLTELCSKPAIKLKHCSAAFTKLDKLPAYIELP